MVRHTHEANILLQEKIYAILVAFNQPLGAATISYTLLQSKMGEFNSFRVGRNLRYLMLYGLIEKVKDSGFRYESNYTLIRTWKVKE